MARKKKTIYDKVSEHDSFFVKEVSGLSNEELEQKIISLARQEEELKEAKKLDVDLQRLEEEVREARKTHTEPLSANRLKRAVVFDILKSRES